MVLYLHSDASYLSASKARSRAGSHFFLSDTPSDPKQAPHTQPTRNGPVHTTCQIMRNVLASAAEAKIGALFLDGQEALPIRVTLDELGHTQPAKPMQTDNSTTVGFANDTIKQKRSKAINMQF
jgi:dsRNA-specific ribonuclease